MLPPPTDYVIHIVKGPETVLSAADAQHEEEAEEAERGGGGAGQEFQARLQVRPPVSETDRRRSRILFINGESQGRVQTLLSLT